MFVVRLFVIIFFFLLCLPVLGITTEGLYRVSGNKLDVDQFRDLYAKGGCGQRMQDEQATSLSGRVCTSHSTHIFLSDFARVENKTKLRTLLSLDGCVCLQ